jgi:acetolactate synthase-1/2/3 large subunit
MTKKIKVTEVIADLLARNGIKTVFGVSGGAALHILHSINRNRSIELITTHHEQAAAMAADSVARISNNFGVIRFTLLSVHWAESMTATSNSKGLR